MINILKEKNGELIRVEDGDYWHEPKDEIERKKIFFRYGYETLVIWEHELKDLDTIIDKVKNFGGGER